MPFDYTTVPPQGEFELVPPNTTALMALTIRPGGVGEDALLKPSKDRMCAMLDCEFQIMGGPHDGRKFWGNLVLEGTSAGHQTAIGISLGILRGIIESARGIHPSDISPEARERRTANLRDFQGIIFTGKIGIEKGVPKNDGTGASYKDKNFLICAVTPDRTEWQRPEEAPPFDGGSPKASGDGATPAQSTSPAPTIARPSWAS
jgi:hypothetical protein